MEGLGLEKGSMHVIDRENILNDNIMLLYTENHERVLSEYPLYVYFRGEFGVDLGGVT